MSKVEEDAGAAGVGSSAPEHKETVRLVCRQACSASTRACTLPGAWLRTAATARANEWKRMGRMHVRAGHPKVKGRHCRCVVARVMASRWLRSDAVQCSPWLGRRGSQLTRAWRS